MTTRDISLQLHFAKMHGLGNDFIVVDAVRQQVSLSTPQIAALADRHEGVGFDQMLLVEPPTRADADLRYRIYNADGGEVEHCGNGARCFARFVYEHGLSEASPLRLQTDSGVVEVTRVGEDSYEVSMGEPVLEPRAIPFTAPARATTYRLEAADTVYDISAVSMGNPHAVLFVQDTDSAPVGTLGAVIETHPRFPRRVNVGFCQVVDRGALRLRVFERGVGETRACGTGACAAVVAARLRGLIDAQVTVHLRGGDLQVTWDGEGTPVRMRGPAIQVFNGSLSLQD